MINKNEFTSGDSRSVFYTIYDGYISNNPKPYKTNHDR